MHGHSCADLSQLCPCLVRWPRKGTMRGRKEHVLKNHRNRTALLSDWHHQEGKERGLLPHFCSHISGSKGSLHFNQSWILASTAFHSIKELLWPRLRIIYGFRYKYLEEVWQEICLFSKTTIVGTPTPHLWGLYPPRSWGSAKFTMPGLYCFLTSKPQRQLENSWLPHDIQAIIVPVDRYILPGRSVIVTLRARHRVNTLTTLLS